MTLLAAAADAATAGGHEPLQWVNLGLKTYLFRIGSFELRWYSLAYLAGILLGYWHLSRMIKAPGAPLAQSHADDLFFYCTLGIILGGRLGYATFYTGGSSDIPSLWAHPSEMVQLWHGGMSFHGGLIGVLLALSWVAWRNKLNFMRVADYIAVCVPFGMLFGRLANFVNGELWGRAVESAVPWGMIFCDREHSETVCLTTGLVRHPSQLYEAGLEGALLVVVMLLLFWKTKARFRPGLLVGVFTAGIALARFTVEFFREPDAQLQRFAQVTGLSMGQWLTIPLIALGVVLVVIALRRPALASTARRPIEIT
ncbi:prolipoprotein diacylglyceryl transferase [Novosphingobium sp. Rr 2-17]|uniref:prolipoprotein diacylglyceryl transferase n=1 Tax=Novosphingobium sp. Rr 2-17 TaxID=555793 RepID=UPI0005BA26EE|nr:prolipoprotein diacylglyceryl transferase [Novosphingobium sp. Rr 2-17]